MPVFSSTVAEIVAWLSDYNAYLKKNCKLIFKGSAIMIGLMHKGGKHSVPIVTSINAGLKYNIKPHNIYI